MTIDNYYKVVVDNGFYTKSSRLKFYLESQLFDGIDFANKSLIDIGGGNGLFGFYAAVNGASKVVVMEPEFDGSSQGMISEFNSINSHLGNLNNISHTRQVLEEYDRKNNQFDYILIHNSINHINEEACINLIKEKQAQDIYMNFFNMLQEISKPNTILIICDCSRKNLFGDLLKYNPIAPSIEWHKHQSPEVWSKYLQQCHYKEKLITWTSPNFLGKFGMIFMKNWLASYLTFSHFKLVMENGR